MFLIIATFSLSFLLTLALIRYKHLHEKISSDNDFSGPQKFHKTIVPRIGGVSIFLSIIITNIVNGFFVTSESGKILLSIMICAFFCFTAGLIEDLTKKVSIKIRLLATIFSATCAAYFFNGWITQVHIPGIDYLLTIQIFCIAFTLAAIAGVVNAYNIVDGFNGLASMVAIISLLATSYVAYQVNDLALFQVCLIVVGAVGGFFAWNYPRGLIFLGDCGAYLIGFIIACVSILLVQRNPTVSPWFALLVNIYPIFETVFTIWRRKVYQGKNPALPDGVHFHSLIYRRLIRSTSLGISKETASYSKNAMTAPYLWLLSSMAVFPASIWWDNTNFLQFFTILFCISYIYVYNRIIKFKSLNFFKF